MFFLPYCAQLLKWRPSCTLSSRNWLGHLLTTVCGVVHPLMPTAVIDKVLHQQKILARSINWRCISLSSVRLVTLYFFPDSPRQLIVSSDLPDQQLHWNMPSHQNIVKIFPCWSTNPWNRWGHDPEDMLGVSPWTDAACGYKPVNDTSFEYIKQPRFHVNVKYERDHVREAAYRAFRPLNSLTTLFLPFSKGVEDVVNGDTFARNLQHMRISLPSVSRQRWLSPWKASSLPKTVENCTPKRGR